MKSRHIIEHDNEVPGVGTYNIDRKHTGGISMGWKHPYGKQDNFPGPGTYEDQTRNIKERAPAFSLSSRYGYDAYNKNPGPNYYTPNAKFISKSAP